MTQRAARHAATALLLALAGLLVVLVTAGLARAATFTVDSTGDGADADPGNGTCATSGAVCTLRAAIEEANALAGADSIGFNIAGSGPHTISPASNLPTVADITSAALTIDGSTAEASVDCTIPATLAIIVQGSGSLDYGLQVDGVGVALTVRGVRFSGFSNTGASGVKANGGVLTAECVRADAGYHGIDCRTDCTVTDTLVDGNAVDGLFCVGGTIDATRVKATDNEDGAYLSGCDGVSITDSHLTDNSHNGVNLDDFPDGNGSDNATLDNITATGNGEQGVKAQGNSDGLTLTDSTLGDNAQYGVKLSADSNGATVSGTDFTAPACNGINDYLDEGGNTFSGNTLCPDPTPTPEPAGCCNIAPGIEGANCLDESFAGTIDSLADCQAIADGFGSTASGFNPDALCNPDPAGSCPAANTPTHTATATGTHTATATATDTAVPTNTSTPTNTPTSTPTATPTHTAAPLVGTGPHFTYMQRLRFRHHPVLRFEQEQRLHFEVTK